MNSWPLKKQHEQHYSDIAHQSDIIIIISRGKEINEFNYLQFAYWWWYWLRCCQFKAIFHKFDKRLCIQYLVCINILLTLFKSESNSEWKCPQSHQLSDSERLWSRQLYSLTWFVPSLVLLYYSLKCNFHLLTTQSQVHVFTIKLNSTEYKYHGNWVTNHGVCTPQARQFFFL